MDKTKSILQLFPDGIREYFQTAAQQNDDLNEIRFRCDRPVLIKRRDKERFLTMDGREIVYIKQKSERDTSLFYIDSRMMEQLFAHICRYSPYAFQEELSGGFITVPGGHRIGVAGQVVRDGNRVREMKRIRFMNIRIAHEIKGVADECISCVYDAKQDSIRSCLIIASPGLGKTTLLRDLIRQISDGDETRRGRTIGVIDERSELAGAYLGEPQNDLGMRSDVLDNCPKAEGMLMLLRSMSPEVIAIDEIATDEDVKNLLYLFHCGVKVFVTVHGTSLKEVRQKPYLKPLFTYDYFEVFLILHPKSIEKIVVNRKEI